MTWLRPWKIVPEGRTAEMTPAACRTRQEWMVTAPPPGCLEDASNGIYQLPIMAATVSVETAVEMSVFMARIRRASQMLARNRDLSRKVAELERKISRHDKEISRFPVVRQLALAPPHPRRGIGFAADLGE